MAESLPIYATFLPRNYLVDDSAVILSATSEASLFRKENLQNPLRSKRWRSTSAGQQQIAYSLDAGATAHLATAIGTAILLGTQLPFFFALVDCNVGQGKTVKLEGAVESTFNTGDADYIYWDFTTYSQSARDTLRFYPGSKTGGAGSELVTRSFWRITLPASGTQDSDGDGINDTYYELGVPVLGIYTILPIGLGLQIDVNDPSMVAESDGGARYADVRPRFHNLTFESEMDDDVTSAALLTLIDTVGVHRHCLVDVWAPSTDNAKKKIGCYYATLGRRDSAARFTRRVALWDTVSMSLSEARA